MSVLRFLLFLVCLLVLTTADAQFTRLHIGVNGLTCSQCTRNVEMRLRRLSFIADVKMNLEHTDGTIQLKQQAAFDPGAIARAVKDAGFSLRFLKADYQQAEKSSNGNSCFSLDGRRYQLIPADMELPQQATLQFIGPDFLPAQEYKRWRPELNARCYSGRGLIYFVTSVKSAG